jgi:hypothetical protein
LSPIDSDIYALGNRPPPLKVLRTEQPWDGTPLNDAGVVKIELINSNNIDVYNGSGFAVGPNLILTAAHVVDNIAYENDTMKVYIPSLGKLVLDFLDRSGAITHPLPL